MKFKLKKEIKNRKLYKKLEKKILVIKYVLKNVLRNDTFSDVLKKKIRYIISTKVIYPNSTKTKLVRRCVITGRSRVSNRILNISRIKLREIFRNNIISGVSKVSW